MWERITSNAFDQEDYFVFLLSSTAPARIVPVVGSFAVNKHTADVLDITAEYQFVTSKQLLDLQKILRREHCITREFVEKFRNINPDTGGARLSPRGTR
ncbi:MAG TPA: hypothetical protein VNK23_07450 [Candidatus Dormibacteraeota bacterium]|nr:hypothetical protein [Candidatus Dormibacteraeota bacterium]